MSDMRFVASMVDTMRHGIFMLEDNVRKLEGEEPQIERPQPLATDSLDDVFDALAHLHCDIVTIASRIGIIADATHKK